MIDQRTVATVAMPPSARDAIKRARETNGPDLERRRWRWTLYFGVWTVVGLLFVGPLVAQCLADQTPIPWSKVASELVGGYLWGLLFPLIWRLSRRFTFDRKRLASRIPINLAIGVLITLLYLTLSYVKNETITSFNLGRWSFDVYQLPTFVFGGFEYYLGIYFAIVAVVHALSFYEKYRDRELKASRLEAQLALAHLEVLKTQLHPHFLFNTLNAVSALMHRDVDAADKMITRLSDLLRLSLDNDHRHQVPLRDEMTAHRACREDHRNRDMVIALMLIG